MWTDILPTRGVRNARSVTVAWRVLSHSRGFVLSVSLPASLVAQLAWKPKDRVSVQYHKQGGLLRLTRSDNPARTWALGGKSDQSNLLLNIPLPDFESPKREAEAVRHEVESGAVVITLPDWAKPKPYVGITSRIADQDAGRRATRSVA